MYQITHILLWILLQESLGWVWFLLAWSFFAHWPDRGVGLSKAAGVLMVSAAVWMLGWLGAPALTSGACWGLAVVLMAAALAVRWRQRGEVAAFLWTGTRRWIGAEAVWLLIGAAFVLLRAGRPEIDGGEKIMDFAFLNAAIRSITLPLHDPWLAGAPASYYYFGYVAWAIVTKMLGTAPGLAYNIAMAGIPAAVAACAYSIALALTLSPRAAVASAAALTLLGTPAGASQIASLGRGYDVWAPTRVIPGTINEFPFFSFFWGDLHPHVMAMPIFLVFCGLAVVALQDRPASIRTSVPLTLLLGLTAGLAVVTSAWDMLPVGIVLYGVLAARAGRIGLQRSMLEITMAASMAAAVALPAVLSADANGVGVGLATDHSPIGRFLLVQGTFMLPAFVLATAKLCDRVGGFRAAAAVIAGCVLIALLTRSPTIGVLAVFAALAWAAFWSAFRVAWLFVAAAATLLLAAECVYIDDIYGPGLLRMNTVFKVHLHAFLLLGFTSGFCVQEIWTRARGRRAARAAVGGALSIAIGLGLIYPAGAIASLAPPGGTFTLDGMRHLEVSNGGDFALIRFLNREVTGTPVIVEATASPYTYSSRISAHTGLPTVVGWANHERVWRRGPAAADEIAGRIASVRTVYEGDAQDAMRVLRAFGVRYVVVGDFERQVYPSGDFAKFAAIGQTVFEAGGTALISVGDGRRP